MRKFTKSPEFVYLSLFIFLGALLRIYRWMDYSLWYDEVMWFFAGKHFPGIKDFSVFSLKPPLFAFFLFLWEKVAATEFLLRLPSVVFGLASILLSYKIADILFNRRTGLIAGFIVAFSPFHVYYSQELTHYALTLCLSLVSMYYLLMCLGKNARHLWIKYAVATAACVYTNYMCLFLLLAQNLFFALVYSKRKELLKLWISSQGVILISLFPLVSFFADSISLMTSSGKMIYHWMPKGDWKHFIQTFNAFNLGYHSGRISRLAGALVFFPLFLRGIWVNRREKNLVLLLFWLFVPIIFSIIIAIFLPVSIYTHRNFFYASIPYYFLVASSLSRLSGKYLVCFLAAIISLFAGSFNIYYRNVFFTPERIYRPGVHLKKDNRGATEYIVDNFEEGDTVVHICRSTNLPFFYYASLSGRETTKDLVKNYYAGQGHFLEDESEMPALVKGYKRVWFVFSHWEPQSLSLPDSEGVRIKRFFDRKYSLRGSEKFEGIEVYLYDIKNGR